MIQYPTTRSSIMNGIYNVTKITTDTPQNAPIIIDPSMLQQFGGRNDEIDLIKLFSNLWDLKRLIIFSTLLLTLLGGLYAFFATPIYESKAYLRPPTGKDIVELKKIALYIDPAGGTGYSTSTVYEKFLGILDSNQAKRVFFQRPLIHDYYMENSGSETQAWEAFLEDLTVNIPANIPKGDITNIDVSFKSKSVQNGSKWLNDYIEHVFFLTKTQLYSDITEAVNSQKEQIDLKIESRFSLYNSELDKEIAKLNEALVIASSLNLTAPLKTDAIDNENSNLMIDEIRRLYKSGTKALRAEIEVLISRKDKLLFVPRISGLQQKQEVLSSLSINKDNIQPAQIDLEAQVSESPIKPKKALILAVSTVIGLMLGVLGALIITIIRSRNKSGGV